MFKNLILLVLIALLTMSTVTVTACSKTTGEVTPPVSSAAEEKPANPTSPIPATTPPEKVSENPGKAISVSEFIKRALNNKYKKGDIVFISGIAETDGKKKVNLYNVGFGGDSNDIIVGPETSGYIVKVRSEEIKTADYPASEKPALASWMSVAKVKVGDKITIKGTYGWHEKSPSPAVVVIDATVQ